MTTTTTETTVTIMLQTDDDGRPCLNVWLSTDESEDVVWTTGAGDLVEAVRYAHALATARGGRLDANVIIGLPLA